MLRWLMMVIATAGLAAALPARAQEESQTGTGYLELYPNGDVYGLALVGGDVADGLQGGLTDAFRGDARVQIKLKRLELTQLMRPEFPEQLKALDEALARDLPSIAVVMLNPQDRVSIRGPQGKKIWIDNDDWRVEYGRQVDAVMKVFKRRKVAVYWVSLPNVRRFEPNEDAQVLNDIIRERVYLNGLKYIDAYAGFADEGGGYSAMGPDIAGKIRLLREPNGVGFTEVGNRKLAHFVERELKRDLTQAKTERTIPLAGNEAEQASIDAGRQAALRAARAASPGPTAAPAGGAAAGASGPLPAVEAALGLAPGTGDQKADSGRINLSLTGPGGREEIVPVDLLRPSIPATVIALVNRKENADKATQLGDLLIDQIPGGLMVMSSITPATDSSSAENRRRLSPTQTPYFRVMVKGERMTPRTDRADDAAWPRSQPPTVAQAAPGTGSAQGSTGGALATDQAPTSKTAPANAKARKGKDPDAAKKPKS